MQLPFNMAERELDMRYLLACTVCSAVAGDGTTHELVLSPSNGIPALVRRLSIDASDASRQFNACLEWPGSAPDHTVSSRLSSSLVLFPNTLAFHLRLFLFWHRCTAT